MSGSLEDDISAGESVCLEFKRSLPRDPMKYLNTAVAFANTEGGRILMGVLDDGTVIGTKDPEADIGRMLKVIRTRCRPKMKARGYVEEVHGLKVAVVEISPGTDRPYGIRRGGDTPLIFERIGSSSVNTTGRFVKAPDVVRPWNAIASPIRIAPPRSPEDAVDAIRTLMGRDIGITADDLGRMGLLAHTEEGLIPTADCIGMLSGNRPVDAISCVCVHSDGWSTRVFSRRVGGPVTSRVSGAVGFVMDHTVNDDGRPWIPESAVREAISNAVAHRDYRVQGPIGVSVYRDRFTVESPGLPPCDVDPSSVPAGSSHPTDPSVHSLAALLGCAGGVGGGLIRMEAACRIAGIPGPEL